MSTAALIAIVSVTVTRAEGLATECGRPETVATLEAADAVLRRWARTAPEGGCYDKCDFVITFADGETYQGRYDLTRADQLAASIGKHVRSFLGCYSGRVKPAHMTPAEFASFVARQKPETVRDCGAFLDTYALA